MSALGKALLFIFKEKDEFIKKKSSKEEKNKKSREMRLFKMIFKYYNSETHLKNFSTSNWFGPISLMFIHPFFWAILY